jgi:ATP-dependent Clp protease ATP-binding subunit ClpB
MARFDRLTLKAQEGVQAAQEEASRRHHQQVDVEHLLFALIEQTDSVVLPLLKKLGADPGRIQTDIEEALNKLPKVEGLVQTYLSPRLGKLLDKAEQEAERLKDEYISTEHFLIAVADGDGQARDILTRHGVTKDRIFTVLVDIRGSQRVTDQNPEDKYQALTRYGRDLTDLARRGKLDPVIGRDEEIRRVVQVLSRRTKNNPVLIGEPGVGKTAIAEGLAQRIVSGDVPEGLKNKRVVALDMGALIAGATDRGEFEDRLKAVLKEVTEAQGEVVHR